MYRSGTGLLVFAACVLTTCALAQEAATPGAPIIKIGPFSSEAIAGVKTRTALEVPDGYLASMGATPKFTRSSELGPGTLAKLQQMGTNAAKVKSAAVANVAAPIVAIDTIPFWMGSFTYQNTTFPYFMAGADPQDGGTTRIGVSIIPVSLYFDEFVDAHGNHLTIDVTPVIDPTVNSPNFEKASYSTGFTQFSDAIQRAEFWFIPQAQDDWHTLLRHPRILTPVQIEVPVGQAVVLKHPDGNLLAIVNSFFWMSQLHTIAQLEPVRDGEIALVVASNTVLGASINDCCIVGTHTTIDEGVSGGVHTVQIFAFSTYLSPGRLSGGFADVTAISHTIAETIDDPFVNNVVPKWLMSGNNPPNCEDLLETGEIIDPLPNGIFPVTVDGFTYHPQTQALLQWFARTSPSNAIDGAFSYPGETVLTAPSSPCP